MAGNGGKKKPLPEKKVIGDKVGKKKLVKRKKTKK